MGARMIGLVLMTTMSVVELSGKFDLRCEARSRSGETSTQLIGVDLDHGQWCVRPSCSTRPIFEATGAIVVLDRRFGKHGAKLERILDLESKTMRDIVEPDPFMPSYVTNWSCTTEPFAESPTIGF